jgi:hypothetical protein
MSQADVTKSGDVSQQRANRISFVIAARNDDYGRNFLNRLTTSVRMLGHLVGRHALDAELVVVEYNAPPDRPSIAKIVRPLAVHELPIRVITVPPEFHERVRQGSRNPFLEYIAKNIGIRRARYDYILCTNPDIIFGETIIADLASKTLDPSTCYRANRSDLFVRHIGEKLAPEQIESLCARSVTRVWTPRGPRYRSWHRWFKRLIAHPHPMSVARNLLLCPAMNALRGDSDTGTFHDAAAGDFLLAHRDAWARVRGYDQIPFNAFLDGYHLAMMIAAGYTQSILKAPIYHMNHDIGSSRQPLLAVQQYKEDVRHMLTNRRPYKDYDAFWGYPDELFSETVIAP